MFCRRARATDHVFSDTTANESFLPSARPSAQPDLSRPLSLPSSVSRLRWWNVCTRPIRHLCQHLLLSRGSISFLKNFISSELSWISGEELNIHTLPPSRGGEEEDVPAEGSLTPVSNWEMLYELLWCNYAEANIYYPDIFFHFIPSFLISSDSTKTHSNVFYKVPKVSSSAT